MFNKNGTMKKIISITLLFCIVAVQCLAQTPPTANPQLMVVVKEDTTYLSTGEELVCEAPQAVKMFANLAPQNYTAQSEWKIFHSKVSATDPIVDRFEENSEYTLNEDGEFKFVLYVTFRDADGDEIEYESDPIKVSISTSKLSCPDGFSPNGDGVNDMFKITCQSIVRLEGYIFNRWGKKLHTFTLDNCNTGWDGRYNGDYVKDGAYFLNVSAIGSDGIKYDIKKTINVLKGFREYSD